MRAFVNAILQIVYITSFATIALFTPLGIYEEIMGAANVNKLLEKLHIPLNYDQIVIIWFICWILVIITRILKAKLQRTL